MTETLLPHGSQPPLREIGPARGWFDLDLKGVWRARSLLLNLVLRDLKVLYRQAALGAAWAILQPIFAVTIFTIVFGSFAKIPSDGAPYAVFAFAAVLPWNYFAESMRRAGLGLVQDGELIRKVYFPRLVMPLSSVIAPLVDFAIAFIVLLCVMLFYGVMPTWRIIAVVPLVAMTSALALGVGLWLGPINVRFRDVKHTLPFLIQIWMYASPVIYPLSIIPQQWRFAYSLNPMVGVIEGFRWALLGKDAPDVAAMTVGAVAIAALLLSGVVFFKKMERSFADLI